eukprot:CAMPEP_0194046454 /NCGR_PEP_ID=MMETSP0009_2-20130614/21119_1 /TAXON_ID=210454 /ORGANISM="Grammatophora oceanica, Strain CCMP 410" /LENGTH=183 /DNA_ID=CAMNT_0038691749 /DNA_START=18 /DNA_END=569 /DNA_ORIENTATION=+
MSLRSMMSIASRRLQHMTVAKPSSIQPSIQPPFPLLLGGVRNMGKAWQRHKKVLRQTKGFRGKSKNCYKIAIKRLQRSWLYAYRSRKVRKRDYRKLWITRLSAASRQYGVRYSQLIPSLYNSNIFLNRKVLSELACHEPFAFKAVLDVVRHEGKLYQHQKKYISEAEYQAILDKGGTVASEAT